MARRSRRRAQNQPSESAQWRRIDLHLHTPGSIDYQEPTISYLDILRQAESRGLDIIAFTDHNSVAGFKAMKQEIDSLRFLEQLERLTAHEARRLQEYDRLLNRVLVLPGFEFTATFGFHILGIFPPDTPTAFLEHLLLTLRVPADQLDRGGSEVGATTDVLTAYRTINEAGGLVIAAHANANNGVFMRHLDFGGQTRIAYTQDQNLHALEVTDLEKRGRYTTRHFFNGTKPEYPRAMRCIQGSDAHRLIRDAQQSRTLGIGDRVTEIFLEDVSFKALSTVLKGNDLSLTRPFRGKAEAFDFVQAAQEQGESVVQSFHRSMAQRGGYLNRILADICGMANTNGGTIYVGVPDDPQEKPTGVREPDGAAERLRLEIVKHFSPEPEVEIDTVTTRGAAVMRITVPPGRELPYAIDQYRFYVRDEAETSLAVRDEIVQLVQRGLNRGGVPISSPVSSEVPSDKQPEPAPQQQPTSRPQQPRQIAPPRTGVEIVASEERDGTIYHTLRDLRNGNLIKGVTKLSARKLWHYAITQKEDAKPNPKRIAWQGDMAIIDVRKKENHVWYDLALRLPDGIHIYYGVTDSGLNEDWVTLTEKA